MLPISTAIHHVYKTHFTHVTYLSNMVFVYINNIFLVIGTYGVAISFVNALELGAVERICSAYQTTITPLPEEIPREYYA